MGLYRGTQLIAGGVDGLTKEDIELGQVDNTKDIDKRVKGVIFVDTKAITEAPNALLSNTLTANFKQLSSVGTPPVKASTTHAHILNIAGWNSSDDSGGWPTQLSIGEGGIAYRRATNANTWGGWRQLADFQKYSGTTIPSNDLGKDGDIYIRY